MHYSKIHLPHTNAKIHSLSGKAIGGGYGAVLLDGGIGGQSSYHSLDDYIATTGVDPMTRKINIKEHRGTGLADRISEKLSKLKLESKGKPKRKNIVMSV